MPHLNMNDCAPGDDQLNLGIMRTPYTEDIFPQIKLRVDPQVSLT
jgi:hypothetical protein